MVIPVRGVQPGVGRETRVRAWYVYRNENGKGAPTPSLYPLSRLCGGVCVLCPLVRGLYFGVFCGTIVIGIELGFGGRMGKAERVYGCGRGSVAAIDGSAASCATHGCGWNARGRGK